MSRSSVATRSAGSAPASSRVVAARRPRSPDDQPGQRLDDQVVLRREVAVDRAERHPRPGHDVVDLEPVRTALLDQGERGVED